MNTERDNFYDWAKDKPDTTSFAGLHRSSYTRQAPSRGMPWTRIAIFVMAAVAVAAAIKLFIQ